MVPSRNGPRGAEVASFGLAIVLYVVTPTPIGNQDIVAPETPASRWRDPSIASTFGTIHAAMFRMPQPVGTQIPGAAARSPRKPRLERHHRVARPRSRGAAGRQSCFRPSIAPPRAIGSSRARRRNRSSRRTRSKRRPGRPSCRRARRPPTSSRTTTPTANSPMRRRWCSPTSRAMHTAATRRRSRTRSPLRCISSRSPNTMLRCRSR